jgi:hypothetical protein
MKLQSAIKLILILLLSATTACEEIEYEPTFRLGHEHTFLLNKQYSSFDGLYSLKITSIADSRCPEGLICIWSGEVSINGEWASFRGTTSFEIHSVVEQENKQPDGITIRIIDAQPYPKYGLESKPENLAVTLMIEKK